jgi:hypothetical protein
MLKQERTRISYHAELATSTYASFLKGTAFSDCVMPASIARCL